MFLLYVWCGGVRGVEGSGVKRRGAMCFGGDGVFCVALCRGLRVVESKLSIGGSDLGHG